MTTENANAGAGGTPNPDGAAPAGGAPTGDTLLNQNQGSAAAGDGQGTPPAGDGAQGSADKGAQGNQPAAPESYEFKMPDGVELDGKAAEEFTAIAKELKLSQADAQRIADVAVKMQQKQAETHAEMVKGWAEGCKTDKEFGGDNLQQNLSVARKAIDTFGSPELKALLNSTGMGNHPEVVRFAFKAGKAISEDTFVQSGSRTPTPDASLEKRLYPNMN
jgi:hypothetical protein